MKDVVKVSYYERCKSYYGYFASKSLVSLCLKMG